MYRRPLETSSRRPARQPPSRLHWSGIPVVRAGPDAALADRPGRARRHAQHARSLLHEAVAQIAPTRLPPQRWDRHAGIGPDWWPRPTRATGRRPLSTVVPRLIDAPVCRPVCATASHECRRRLPGARRRRRIADRVRDRRQRWRAIAGPRPRTARRWPSEDDSRPLRDDYPKPAPSANLGLRRPAHTTRRHSRGTVPSPPRPPRHLSHHHKLRGVFPDPTTAGFIHDPG
jgi:hypothetical protein